jgi:hypothetical protein
MAADGQIAGLILKLRIALLVALTIVDLRI